ncbi:hypothetical protein [Sessilibacter corallicola]|uniref:hypothetical protein n=1 Tax=Sessilibacter corallicola TaxID=2904075 RepID=UPI001E5AE1AB|nr:hypothetical protein [Sessilibacter corallicola]MCE2029551.1 hypothetical protein [Sessilibacter corallicola]
MHSKLALATLTFLISSCSSIIEKPVNNAEVFDNNYRRQCERLQSLYPFNKESKKDISITEFNRYFAPQIGILTTQLSSHEKFAKTYNSHLSAVKAIQNYFYSNGSTSAKRQVSIKTKQSPEGYQYISLKFNGNVGPQITGPRLLYNVELPLDGASISLVAKSNSNDENERFYSGPWAFLRFLDESEVIESSQNSMTVATPLSTGDTNHSIEYTVNHLSQWESIRNAFFCPE